MPDLKIDEALAQLADRAWSQFRANCNTSFVVRPAMPILFFGDVRRYLASPVRMVTVGLNPSGIEFPAGDCFKRFPHARNLCDSPVDSEFRDQYVQALSDYFRTEPYRRWFNAYEPVLNGAESSYYDGYENTALHTDICSPIATDPTWSKLHPSQRAQLDRDGVPLWHDLIRYLDPDVLLVSIARQYMDRIGFPIVARARTLHTVERNRPYSIWTTTMHIGARKECHVVSGMAAQTPLGTVSGKDKQIIGARVREMIDG
jgi:hypothetical protein